VRRTAAGAAPWSIALPADSCFEPATCSPLSLPDAAYNVIVLSNVCYLFSPDADLALLQRHRHVAVAVRRRASNDVGETPRTCTVAG
jgi:hypothetical protein